MTRMDRLSTYRTQVSDDGNGNISVIYAGTSIVRFSRGDSYYRITLDMGGWDTVTTRRKMNQTARQFGLGYRVYRERGTTWCSVDVQDGSTVKSVLPADKSLSFSLPAS